jgi:acetyltransferase-like isoleucine patch superfamily enzyme
MNFKAIANKLVYRIAAELGTLIHQVDARIAYKTLPKFVNSPKNLKIDFPRRIINGYYMSFGDNVWFGPGTLLIAVTRYPTLPMQNIQMNIPLQHFSPKIVIGNRVTSTADLQIAAHSEVVIEDDVMFASNVHIEDGSHGYLTATIPYKYQPIGNIAPILIKYGCWIGQNVVILPGVTIGECSIIGANSVVTTSIPARSIAVGAPARVIKQWDDITHRWIAASDSCADIHWTKKSDFPSHQVPPLSG